MPLLQMISKIFGGRVITHDGGLSYDDYRRQKRNAEADLADAKKEGDAKEVARIENLLKEIESDWQESIRMNKDADGDAEQLERLERLLEQAKRLGESGEVKELQEEIDKLKNSTEDGLLEDVIEGAFKMGGLENEDSQQVVMGFNQWKREAESQGFVVREVTHPDGEGTWFVAKDKQGNSKGTFNPGDHYGYFDSASVKDEQQITYQQLFDKCRKEGGSWGIMRGDSNYVYVEYTPNDTSRPHQNFKILRDDIPSYVLSTKDVGVFTLEEAQKIGETVGVDFNEVDLEQFRKGLSVELEHVDLTSGDPSMTAKIVLAHLREMPDYYGRLDKMESGAQTQDAGSSVPIKEVYQGYAIKGPANTTNGIKYLVVTHKGEGWAETTTNTVQEAKAWIDSHKHPSSYVGTQHSDPFADKKTKDSGYQTFYKGYEITVDGPQDEVTLYDKDGEEWYFRTVAEAKKKVDQWEDKKNTAEYMKNRGISDNKTKDAMRMTNDPGERGKQKEMLRGLYPDYDPKHHDAFVARYNKEEDKKNTAEYMKNRGISDNKTKDAALPGDIIKFQSKNTPGVVMEGTVKFAGFRFLVVTDRHGYQHTIESEKAGGVYKEMTLAGKTKDDRPVGTYKGYNLYLVDIYSDGEKLYQGVKGLQIVRGKTIEEIKQKIDNNQSTQDCSSRKSRFRDAIRRFKDRCRTSDGGVGSGVKGHVTAKQMAAMKARKAGQKQNKAKYRQIEVSDLVSRVGGLDALKKKFKYSEDVYDHLIDKHRELVKENMKAGASEVGEVNRTRLMDYCDDHFPSKG